jgi:hypothetical protein
MSRKSQIELHLACIRRHFGRWIAGIGRLDSGKAVAEARALWYDVRGIGRAAVPFGQAVALIATEPEARPSQRER